MELPEISKSKLCEYQYVEDIDTDLLIKILQQPELIQDTPEWNETSQLKKLLKRSKNDKNPVTYKDTKKGINNFGRVQGSSSIGTIRNEIRGTLCFKKYVDIDIANCHPEILNQLLSFFNLKNDIYNNYVNNRESELKKIMDIYQCSRKVAKNFFLLAGYGASFKTWREDNNISDTIKEIGLWDNIQNEIKPLASHFISKNIKLFEKYKRSKLPQYNFELGFLSKCLQHYERHILEHMVDFFMDKGFISSGLKKNCILIHDGLMIKKNNSLTKNTYKALNQYIFDKTGLTLKVIPKPMNHYLDKIIETEVDINCHNEFDMDYMAELPLYKNKKIYFEMFHAKIITSDHYKCFLAGKVVDKKKTDLVNSYQHLSEKNITDDDESVVIGKFIKKWIDDASIKYYMAEEFTPYNGVWKGMNEGKIFNTFEGYSPYINKDTKYNLDTIKDIILNLCENNEVYYEFFINWLAQIIQYPTEKKAFAIIINGSQGTGKGFLVQLMKNVLGRAVISDDKPDTFFGKYVSEGLKGKLLINLNEISLAATREHGNKIKSLVSEDTAIINPKNINAHEIKSYGRVLVTTNEQNSIRLDSTSNERRWLAFRATDKYMKWSEDQWENIFKDINKPEVIASWYQYLNSRDLSNYSFKKERKLCFSETYLALIKTNLPSVIEYIIHIIEEELFLGDSSGEIEIQDDLVIIRKTYFYQKYKTWNRKFGDPLMVLKAKQFWAKLIGQLRLPFEETRSYMGGRCCIKFFRSKLIDKMKSSKWIS